MSFNVQTIAEFEKAFKKLLKKYPSLKNDIYKLVLNLEENPFIGTALGNDFYKIRLSITSKGKGKSGGGRVITCVKIVQHTIYLAAIYDKADKATLTDVELKLLAKKIG
jgi:hypothetical protein